MLGKFTYFVYSLLDQEIPSADMVHWHRVFSWGIMERVVGG